MIRTLLKFRNIDSTLDLNDQFSKFFKRGIVSGGDVLPVAGQLAIDITPFKLMGVDGMAVVETGETVRLTVLAGQTSVVVFKSQYVPNNNPIYGFEVLEISAYNSRLDKDYLCVFGTITLGPTATEVLAGDVSLQLRDALDPIGRSAFRGYLDNDSLLPTQHNRPGDFYAITSGLGDIPALYMWNGVNWQNITDAQIVASLLAAHRANLFSNEIHLTDEQAIAALGTAGQPGVEPIETTIVVASSQFILDHAISNDSLVTGKVVRFLTTGTLPAPLVAGTDYYAIYIDDVTFRVATSEANAIANNYIVLGGAQAGVQTAVFEENKYVTSTDPRLPDSGENDALIGYPSTPPPSGSNPYVTAAYGFAAPTAKTLSPTAGPIVMNLSDGPIYVGTGGAGTAAQYFKLYDPTFPREYIDPVTQLPIQIAGVFKDAGLTQPLIPSSEPSVLADNGFYTGMLYLTLSSVMNGSSRVVYGQKQQLNQIDRGAFLRITPTSAQTSQEAILKFQEISGRLFGTVVPADEQNINLRLSINALHRYLVTGTAASFVVSDTEFSRMRTYADYAANFPLQTNEVLVVAGGQTFTVNNTPAAVTAFDATITTPDTPFVAVITYAVPPAGIADVLPGYIFTDGAGERFRILNYNIANDNQILIYTGGRTVSTTANANAGKVVVGNNPRQLELTNDHRTSMGVEIIPVEGLVIAPEGDEELPPGGGAVGAGTDYTLIGPNVLPNQGNASGAGSGRPAYQVLPKIQNNRYEERVRLYGGWKNDSNQVVGEVSQGSCGIEYTGRVQNLLLFTNWDDTVSYGYRVFVDGAYHSEIFPSGPTDAIADTNYVTYMEGRPQLHPIDLGLALDTGIHTVRVEITQAGTVPFCLAGIGVQNGITLREEAGNVFSETDSVNTATVDVQSILTDNRVSASKSVRYINQTTGLRAVATLAAPYYEDPNKVFTGSVFTLPGGAGDPLAPSGVGDVLYVSDRSTSTNDSGNSVYRRIVAQTSGDRTIESPISFNSTQVEYAFRIPVRPDTGAPVIGAPKSNFDKEFSRLAVEDWTVGRDGDIGNVPLLSQESRVTVLADGSTALRMLDCTRVETDIEGRETGLELSTSGSELQTTFYGTRLDLIFVGNQGAVSVDVEIDGAYSYTVTLAGDGLERHTVMYDANLQSHSVRLSNPVGAGKVVVGEWVVYDLADPAYVGVPIAEYNLLRNSNSKLFPEFARTNTLAISNQGVKLFDPMTYGARFLNGAVTLQDAANPYFGTGFSMTTTGDGFVFYFLGSGFDLFFDVPASVNMDVWLNDAPMLDTSFPTASIINYDGVAGFSLTPTGKRAVITDLPFNFYKVEVRHTGGSGKLLAIGTTCLIGSALKRNLDDVASNHLHFGMLRDVREFLTLEPQQVGVTGSGESVAVTAEGEATDAIALSPAAGYQAIVQDDFTEVPTSPAAKVDPTYTNAQHNFANNLYRLAYVTKTLNVGTISTTVALTAPVSEFEVQANDIVYFVTQNQWRRIQSVNSLFNLTIDTAIPAGATAGQTVMVAQAVYSKDLVNIGDVTEQTRLSDIFPGESIQKVLIEYQDSAAPGDAQNPVDSVPDFVSTAHVVVSVSNSGLQSDTGLPVSNTFSAPYARPLAPDFLPDYPLSVNTDQERLFAVFFPNPNNLAGLSGFKNVLDYRISFYEEPTLQKGGVLNSAYCYNDGSQTEINCQAPVNVSGQTELELGFAYTMNVGTGTVDGDIEVIVNGQVIPRIVAGAIATGDIAYSELTSTRIRFNQDLITAIPTLSFHVRRRLGVQDTNQVNAARLSFLSDLWVGTAADVAAGFANYSDLQAAVTAAAAGQVIRIRPNLTVSGAVSIAKNVKIEGAGYSSFMDGIITLDSGCDYTTIKGIRCQQFVIQSGADGNYIVECFWTNVPTNAGTGNYYHGITV